MVDQEILKTNKQINNYLSESDAIHDNFPPNYYYEV